MLPQPPTEDHIAFIRSEEESDNYREQVELLELVEGEGYRAIQSARHIWFEQGVQAGRAKAHTACSPRVASGTILHHSQLVIFVESSYPSFR